MSWSTPSGPGSPGLLGGGLIGSNIPGNTYLGQNAETGNGGIAAQPPLPTVPGLSESELAIVEEYENLWKNAFGGQNMEGWGNEFDRDYYDLVQEFLDQTDAAETSPQAKGALEKSEKESRIKSGAISGGRNPDGNRAEEHAKRYYGLVRSMTTDVQKIAKTTGFSEEKIKAVKDFIFNEKHDLGGEEPEYFAPDYMMAESWRRLIAGIPEKHDLTLIQHEILERELMEKGLSQDEAHIAATEKFNYAKEAKEFYGKTKKHSD